MNGAIYTEGSKNAKLSSKDSKVDTTYASIKNTCPSSCELKDKGCYAQGSFVGMINWRMDRRAKNSGPLQVARAEANAINDSHDGKAIPSNRDLRLHVAGDSRTVKGTRILNKAVGVWKARGGRDCWSYTHAFLHVPRKEWSNVSILASVGNVGQVKQARAQGYAPAIVVAEHPSDKMFLLPGCDTKWIPCPAQTKDNVSCASCRLCMKSDWLYKTNRGIAFAAHGVSKNKIKRRLTVIK